MQRRTLLAGLLVPCLTGCVERYVPSDGGNDSTTRRSKTTTRSTKTTTRSTETTTVAHRGPVEPTDGIAQVRGDEDSVSIELDGYDSSEFAEAQFTRTTDSTGVPVELSRSQVTSTPELQNALAYFGPDIEEVSVSMPVSDGYDLANALDSYWEGDTDARLNDDEEEVYEFEGVRFTALVLFYE